MQSFAEITTSEGRCTVNTAEKMQPLGKTNSREVILSQFSPASVQCWSLSEAEMQWRENARGGKDKEVGFKAETASAILSARNRRLRKEGKMRK